MANHHATQVYYLPWACQKDKKLAGWYLVQLVSPRGKAPVPNDDDYNFDPSTGTEEFYEPEGLEGTLEIDILSLMDMEVDNDIDEDEGEEVRDAKDLEILEQWRMVLPFGEIISNSCNTILLLLLPCNFVKFILIY